MPGLRVLLTGAGGLVGGVVGPALGRLGLTVIAGQHETPVPAGLPIQALDVTSPSSVEAAIDAARPDAVVHAAALAEADRCQAEPDRAFALNVRAPESMARTCARRGVALVCLSTDLVFAGDRAPYAETDAPDPLLTYGRTRRQGEEAVLAAHPEAAVARLSLVSGCGYGSRGTATEWIAWALAAGRRLRLYTDQYRTPIDTLSIADGLALLLRQRARGLFHLGGPERISRHEMGRRLAAALGLPGDLIEPVAQADHCTGAPRPADVSLDSGRARRELGFAPRRFAEAIAAGRPKPATL
jgi:dTDP-4-dehydrorhamnose reductase